MKNQIIEKILLLSIVFVITIISIQVVQGVEGSTNTGVEIKNCKNIDGGGFPWFKRVCAICKVRFTSMSGDGTCYTSGSSD